MRNLDISMGIGETSRVTEASTTQIRYWEKRGLIELVSHGKGQNKRYNLENISTILYLKMMLDNGYTLNKAAEMAKERLANVGIIRMFVSTRVNRIAHDGENTLLNLGPLENDPKFDVIADVSDGGVTLNKEENGKSVKQGD
ncbi:MerR family transcriptional regulator [Secundilactobacillus paracollinoides]|uniref:MerR family transcriptional regulator n=1 Tax=Secundilactobacillus paracollinoides TaxID=240427 RepID=UPI001CDB45B4|nr:MerR family transcriptional regulator [Secundilactobacillus paracollinoides]